MVANIFYFRTPHRGTGTLSRFKMLLLLTGNISNMLCDISNSH